MVGDAAGSINPVNGEGIAYAYETGRMAAVVLGNALSTGDGLALREYDERLQETYGLYFKVARAFVKIIGRPELMRALVSTGKVKAAAASSDRFKTFWFLYVIGLPGSRS